ncbi:MAG: glycoside hydrolase family 3 N-terminal domain-containing protein [Burkholderiales bacterium]
MKNIDALIAELTVEEKAALLAGTKSMNTNAVPRLGIPGLTFADGPHGLRKLAGSGVDGMADSEPATAFPTSATIASGWNEKNVYLAGEAIGREALCCGVNVVLGPGVNIKRDPRCGRNFEYYSEDPLLAGKLGSAFVKGVQSKGVGVSLKHFAANNAYKAAIMLDNWIPISNESI